MVEAVRAAGIKIVMHGGGLWDPATELTPEKSDYIRRNDEHIAVLTGMPFGPGYLDGLLKDTGVILWSRPTIAAVLAAGAMKDGAELTMMHAIQTAHYVAGKQVVTAATLSELAGEIALSPGEFDEVLEAIPVDEHIQATRRWMHELGLRGFPSFVLQRDTELIQVQHEPFYGKPKGFVRAIHAAMATNARA